MKTLTRSAQQAIERLKLLNRRLPLALQRQRRPIDVALDELCAGQPLEIVIGALTVNAATALVADNPCRRLESEAVVETLRAILYRGTSGVEEERLDGASVTLRLYPSGTSFSPFDPRPEDIHVEDVAHALALTNRFGGHTAEPYSVAQHCLLVAWLCQSQGADPLWGLLHEVAEALSGLGDVCGPTKRHPLIRGPVKELEGRIERAAAIRFGLPEDFARSPGVKRADRIAYAWEDRDLRGLTTDDAWTKPLLEEVPATRLAPMGWRDAEAAFIACAASLLAEGQRR